MPNSPVCSNPTIRRPPGGEPLPEDVEADMIAVAVDERVGQEHAPHETRSSRVRPTRRSARRTRNGRRCRRGRSTNIAKNIAVVTHSAMVRKRLTNRVEARADKCRSTSCRRCVAAIPACHFCDRSGIRVLLVDRGLEGCEIGLGDLQSGLLEEFDEFLLFLQAALVVESAAVRACLRIASCCAGVSLSQTGFAIANATG